MSSLADKLKALGVQVGPQQIQTPPDRQKSFNIERVMAGRALETPLGETFVVEERYPVDYRHGQCTLRMQSPREMLAAWAGDARVSGLPPERFAFIDTETTGLSTAAGVFAFLIGVGRFEGDEFHLAQFFLRDPVEEPAQLNALEEFIAPCEALVTFNGKSFDMPLLYTRFASHGWRPPWKESAHVDLLHLSRKLWRDRLPSRSLGNLEWQILRLERSEEDVPGWMVPSLYMQYLRSGDARELKRVFYHNAIDVVSMAALFNHIAGLLHDPLDGSVQHAVDLIALAKLYEDIGELDNAVRLYLHGLEHDLPHEVLLRALERLALIYKRNEEFSSALRLWEQAARFGDLGAYEELAKYYEHRAQDIEQAWIWTQAAIKQLESPGFSLYERRQMLPAWLHRLERLERKRNRS